MKENGYVDNIKENLAENISKNFEECSNLIKEGTKDPNNFIDINTIESYLSSFVKKNVNDSLDAFSEILNSVDEKDLINLKKRISKIRNSTEE